MSGWKQITPEEFEAMQALVEQTHANLQDMHKQLHLNHKEHMAAMTTLTGIAKAQLEISQEYKTWVGDPLRKGSYAISIIRSVFVWVAGTLLTLWGLKEVFDTFFVPRVKP